MASSDSAAGISNFPEAVTVLSFQALYVIHCPPVSFTNLNQRKESLGKPRFQARLLAPSGALVFIVGYYIPSRGQRQKKNSRFFSRQMFFFVFFKVKGGLFSCIFCLNDSFICKFGVFLKIGIQFGSFQVEIL